MFVFEIAQRQRQAQTKSADPIRDSLQSELVSISNVIKSSSPPDPALYLERGVIELKLGMNLKAKTDFEKLRQIDLRLYNTVLEDAKAGRLRLVD